MSRLKKESIENKWILYQTTNLVNEKIYVGVHKLANTKRSRNYLGSGYALKPAIEKYGIENFTRVTLAEFNCPENAYDAEAKVVTADFILREDTYNIRLGGKGCWGLKHSEEAKKKMSFAKKGTVVNPETRAKMSAAKKGKPKSEAHKAKLAAANKGKITPKEVQAKIAAANSKPVIINGKYYCSIKIASEIEKIDKGTLGKRVRNPKLKWSEWRFASKIF